MFLLFFLLLFVPILLSASRYWLTGSEVDWQSADRSSAGLLPQPTQHRPAVVRVFAARTVRWRGIFAVHSWIVIKEADASRYTRYDYTAWGTPIRVNGFEADGRWFGGAPQLVASLDGAAAAEAVPKIKAAIENYRFAAYGDYQVWPGPNSNTFVATITNKVPELRAVLPPTAIGKDYPYDGAVIARTATGLRVSLAGYLGFTIGLIEGFEINFFGAVVGVDLLRPALKVPGLGRIGMTQLSA
jgi:hypothetical protein